MKHAPYDSRLGQLQRGRGAGFLAACASPRAARDELLQCVVADPRLDRHIESRDAYYGELVERVDLDLAPIVQRASEDDAGLAVGVLAELAARRHPGAVALIEHPGRRPQASAAVLEHLRCYPGWAAAHLQRPAVQHLADHLEQRDELIDDVEIYGEFWERWRATLPEVERAFIDSAAKAAAEVALAPPPLRDPAALSTVELLDHVGGENTSRASAELMQRGSEPDRALLAAYVEHARHGPRRVAIAAQTLGMLGDLRLLAAAEAIFARSDLDAFGVDHAFECQRRAAFHQYFRALPSAVSLPLSRVWWPRGGHLRIAAGAVLERDAEPADREWLEDFVQRWACLSSHHTISEIDALAHLGDARSLPTLITVAEQAASSWARLRAMRGIAAMAKDDRAQTVLTEALWDSEDAVRELACQHGTLSLPAARSRLAEIAAAPLLDASTREVAAARMPA